MKVVSTQKLKAMCDNARRKGYNRLLDKKTEILLDPYGLHILSQPIVHGDVENVRCTCVLLKIKGKKDPIETMLDFTFEDWNKILEYKPKEK